MRKQMKKKGQNCHNSCVRVGRQTEPSLASLVKPLICRLLLCPQQSAKRRSKSRTGASRRNERKRSVAKNPNKA
eukprot:260231-Amphidinium_carterae.1